MLKRLAGGGRPARLHKWIGQIRDRPRPTFYLHHALLPHEPWIYLPSGHQSRPSGNDPIEGINRPGGFHDRGSPTTTTCATCSRSAIVDRQLGLIVERLRRTGLFDRSLFIVVADHGYAFEVGVKERRQVTETNFEQLAAVPFFVKLPGQTRGRIDDRVVSILDVVPTIADVLGTQASGGSTTAARCSRAPPAARTRVAMPRRDFSRVVSFSRARVRAPPPASCGSGARASSAAAPRAR